MNRELEVFGEAALREGESGRFVITQEMLLRVPFAMLQEMEKTIRQAVVLYGLEVTVQTELFTGKRIISWRPKKEFEV